MTDFFSKFPILLPIFVFLFILLVPLLFSFMFRTVVPTNMVHIVQSRKKTTSYGTGADAGNVYYKWPSWLPLIGVTTVKLPVSNFDLSFKDYEAYDKDRVPFVLDITAFFRIADTNKAAQRVSSIDDLHTQLKSIIQGAVRKILASHDINSIMTDRATFGNQFTSEVETEVANWGVDAVKNIELMDMRDSKGSTVISDIMAKKSSFITMESRVEVANNRQKAEVAEIEARQTIDIRNQEAEELVGKRTAEKDKAVGVAEQKSQQEIKIEEAITVEKQKDVEKIKQVRDAQIVKEAAIVTAEQNKETAILNAQGALESTKLEAQGIETKGKAEGEAEKAKQLAPVQAQIELAKEIGSNEEYQKYLVLLEFAKVYQVVGSEQAKALQNADVKIIANGGNAPEGLKGAMDLFGANGGLAISSMLEAINNTPQGEKLFSSLNNLLAKKSNSEIKSTEEKEE